jgi:uncharacterized protein YggU (UPF0235/DUF167 family)
MIGREFHFHDGKKGAALAIRVIRYRGNNKIHKLLKDGTVVVHLKSKAEDQNTELIKFLSEQLNIAQKRFDIIAGHDGDEKLISVLDIEPKVVQEKILDKIS